MLNVMYYLVAIEDIVMLAAAFAFLYLRQKPYTILAVVLVAAIIIMNTAFVYIPDTSPLFIMVGLIPVLIMLVARPFLPPARKTLFGVRLRKVLFLLLSFLSVFLIVMVIVVVLRR